MKTIKRKSSIVVTIILLMTLMINKIHAQIGTPYNITNHLNCAIDVAWVAYNCVPSCASGTLSVAANTTAQLPANFGACNASTICDLDITVFNISGTNPGITANISSSPGPNYFSSITGCTGTGPFWTWTTAGFQVEY